MEPIGATLERVRYLQNNLSWLDDLKPTKGLQLVVYKTKYGGDLDEVNTKLLQELAELNMKREKLLNILMGVSDESIIIKGTSPIKRFQLKYLGNKDIPTWTIICEEGDEIVYQTYYTRNNTMSVNPYKVAKMVFDTCVSNAVVERDKLNGN